MCVCVLERLCFPTWMLGLLPCGSFPVNHPNCVLLSLSRSVLVLATNGVRLLSFHLTHLQQLWSDRTNGSSLEGHRTEALFTAQANPICCSNLIVNLECPHCHLQMIKVQVLHFRVQSGFNTRVGDTSADAVYQRSDTEASAMRQWTCNSWLSSFSLPAECCAVCC